jgi:hypothetical protein
MEMLRLNSLEEYLHLDSTLWGIRQHHQDVAGSSLEMMEDGRLDVVGDLTTFPYRVIL